MSEIFFVSDTHFGHESVCTKFVREDGSPLRAYPNADVMNEDLVERWNSVVKPGDLVYHLGDVVINSKHLPWIGKCNGDKVLIQGNHDPIGGKRGRKFNFDDYFRDVVGMKVLGDMILTHIPIHADNVVRFGTNVHGHLHDKQIMWEYDTGMGSTWHADYATGPDPRYLCVSVEHTDFKPISIDDVRQRIAERQKASNYNPAEAWGNGSEPN